jgi:divinyl protochlorophyllide a 8-vinyl-reductase
MDAAMAGQGLTAADVRVNKVGPNAILQSREALEALGGPALAQELFAKAGLSHLLDEPPADMIAQDVAARLHRCIADTLPPQEALSVARDAGARTGRYILAHRIPKPAQAVLRLMPAPLSGRMLLKAIRAHAWTFAGSGAVMTPKGRGLALEIADNPLALPGCPWHVAVFEVLFRTLVHPRMQVIHDCCCAQGGACCRFEFRRG